MSSSRSRPLQIAAIGLGEKMVNALSLFFRGPCQITCVLAPEESAEICIVDLDSFQGTQRLEEQLRNFPQRPLIVISLYDKVLDGTFLLRKPINSLQLCEAIKLASAQLNRATEKPIQIRATGDSTTDAEIADRAVPKSTPEDRLEPRTGIADTNRSEPATHRAAMYLDERSTTTYIGSAPDVDFSDQKQVAKAQYDPNDFLQSYLARAYADAASKGSGVILECQAGSITIPPQSTKVMTTINDHKLRTLSIVPIARGTVSVVTGDRALLDGGSALPPAVDRDALMWKTALWAARGRVPLGTSFMIPVEMRRWPNLTRLLIFPHALRIAALWAKAPYSLMDTANHLNIPQRNVFAFYSAAHAIGLVSMVESDSVSLIKPTPSVTPGRKGILSRIINRLKWQ